MAMQEKDDVTGLFKRLGADPAGYQSMLDEERLQESFKRWPLLRCLGGIVKQIAEERMVSLTAPTEKSIGGGPFDGDAQEFLAGSHARCVLGEAMRDRRDGRAVSIPAKELPAAGEEVVEDQPSKKRVLKGDPAGEQSGTPADSADDDTAAIALVVKCGADTK